MTRWLIGLSLLALACGGGAQQADVTPAAAPEAEEPEAPAGEEMPADPAPAAESPAEEPPAPAGPDALAMAERGAGLYGEHCAKCHGKAGEGSKKAPPVVGKNALPLDAPAKSKKRKGVQFRTALDVFKWVKVNMPGDEPGSLSDDDYLAIMAFDLKANGVDLTGKTLDAPTAEAIVLH